MVAGAARQYRSCACSAFIQAPAVTKGVWNEFSASLDDGTRTGSGYLKSRLRCQRPWRRLTNSHGNGHAGLAGDGKDDRNRAARGNANGDDGVDLIQPGESGDEADEGDGGISAAARNGDLGEPITGKLFQPPGGSEFHDGVLIGKGEIDVSGGVNGWFTPGAGGRGTARASALVPSKASVPAKVVIRFVLADWARSAAVDKTANQSRENIVLP